MDPQKKHFRKMHKEMTKLIAKQKAAGWDSKEHEEATLFVQHALWMLANNETNVVLLEILARRTERLAKEQERLKAIKAETKPAS